MYSLDAQRGGRLGFKAYYSIFNLGKFYPCENCFEPSGSLGMTSTGIVLKVSGMRSKQYCHILILHSPARKDR